MLYPIRYLNHHISIAMNGYGVIIISDTVGSAWRTYSWADSNFWTAAGPSGCSSSGQYLYFGSSDYADKGNRKFLVSSDYGYSWTISNNAPYQKWLIIKVSSDGQSVYALLDSPLSVKLSTDHGYTWTDISPPGQSTYSSICASKNFDVLFISSRAQSLTVSYDKGQTWEFIELPIALNDVDCSDTGQYLFAISNRYTYFIIFNTLFL